MEKSDTRRLVNMWAMSGELGLLIALPLVIMVLIGIKLDRIFNTMPLFIIIGMVFAATVSVVAVRRKIKRLS